VLILYTLWMPINPIRIKKLNDIPYEGGTVIYQMCRDIRAVDNDALLFAQELAKSKGAQLIVNYVIWNYTWEGATRRFYDWVLSSLEEVEKELRTHNIPLIVTFEEEKLFNKKEFTKVPEHVGAVVIDQLPLHFMRKWKEQFLKHAPHMPLYEVDAHNCIPVWELSAKQEFAAHTIRRKVHTKLPEFLEEFGKLAHHEANQELMKTTLVINWQEVSRKIICDEGVSGTGDFIPGSQAGKEVLKSFLQHKLDTYDTSRNEINSDGQSNLSPYIAHGNLSRRSIILELLKKTKLHTEDAFDDVKNGSNGEMGSVAAFIEECVVRAEISENFCFYNPHYNSYDGFPAWAKKTLEKASTDAREYIYSYDQFRKGETDNDLWNAAQMQMVTTGKMHGYMRMYWAKKILQWSASPEEAMKIAVRLNDVYELDGRDPNGYVGCAWSIGGVHDRAWFGRPIFGMIRFMAESGVKKRGDIKEYVNRFSRQDRTLFT
jgi:deoxyribodipyrimidine photo-lyase